MVLSIFRLFGVKGASENEAGRSLKEGMAVEGLETLVPGLLVGPNGGYVLKAHCAEILAILHHFHVHCCVYTRLQLE